jgi:hypothetical protein
VCIDDDHTYDDDVCVVCGAENGPERDDNLPSWPSASAVYSHAYRVMEKSGADDLLIEALGQGDEETIKANLLRINDGLFKGGN